MSDPIADPSDLAVFLGADVDDDRALLMIRLAQDKCESLISPLPAIAVGVVLDVAARGYGNPTGATQTTVGPFSQTLPGGVWLTRANITDLRRLAGGTGAFTVDLLPSTAGQNIPWWDNGFYPYDSVTFVNGLPTA